MLNNPLSPLHTALAKYKAVASTGPRAELKPSLFPQLSPANRIGRPNNQCFTAGPTWQSCLPGLAAEKAEVQLQLLVLPQTSAGHQAKHFALNSKATKSVQGSPLISDQREREQNIWPALPPALLGHGDKETKLCQTLVLP